MRYIWVARHAKSSWKFPELSDFNRPLNKRGRRDLPRMAGIMAGSKLRPELILSSPAIRAKATAEAYHKAFELPNSGLVFDEGLYHASVDFLQEFIMEKVPVRVKKIMLAGHNPGLTDFVNQLGKEYIDNIPTCGIYGLQWEAPDWAAALSAKGDLFCREYPKKYRLYGPL